MPLAIGVLPYPLTFLCTDFISEIYGRKRANNLVWVGFLVNLWLAVILWLGGVLPGFDSAVPDVAGRLLLGTGVAFGDALHLGGEGRKRALLLLSFFLPLGSLVIYHNAYPYFYVTVIPPASLLCGALVSRIETSVGA